MANYSVTVVNLEEILGEMDQIFTVMELRIKDLSAVASAFDDYIQQMDNLRRTDRVTDEDGYVRVLRALEQDKNILRKYKEQWNETSK